MFNMKEPKEMNTCRCPQCQFEGPMSEFKPKQYAGDIAKGKQGELKKQKGVIISIGDYLPEKEEDEEA